MDGEHVGLLGAARIDALRRLRRRQRGETVAIDRGALEIERVRGLLHFAGELDLRTAWLLPDRKALASRTSSAYSAKSISWVQGAEQRLI